MKRKVVKKKAKPGIRKKLKARAGKKQAQVGKAQIGMSNDRKGHGAMPGQRLTNKDKLELAREGTKNFVQGTIKKNRNSKGK